MSLDVLYFPYPSHEDPGSNPHNISLVVGHIGRKDPVTKTGQLAVCIEQGDDGIYASAHFIMEVLNDAEDYWENASTEYPVQCSVHTLVDRVVLGEKDTWGAIVDNLEDNHSDLNDILKILLKNHVYKPVEFD